MAKTSIANNDQLKFDLHVNKGPRTTWDHSEKLQTSSVMVVVAVIY